MALSIKDPETDRLARELARTTGESLTDAIRHALAERLERERARRTTLSLATAVAHIQDGVARLPVLEPGDADALLGYDDAGLPT